MPLTLFSAAGRDAAQPLRKAAGGDEVQCGDFAKALFVESICEGGGNLYVRA
jgi:hypothetical protein